MGKRERPWQEIDYVLGYFGRRGDGARKAYGKYVEAAVGQGRRGDLTGGGLVRSLGGWKEVKRLRAGGQGHRMSDERILGEPEFVEAVLSQAHEGYECSCELKRRGYDLTRIARRVADIYGIEEGEIFLKGRQQRRRTGTESALFLGGQRGRHVA